MFPDAWLPPSVHTCPDKVLALRRAAAAALASSMLETHEEGDVTVNDERYYGSYLWCCVCMHMCMWVDQCASTQASVSHSMATHSTATHGIAWQYAAWQPTSQQQRLTCRCYGDRSIESLCNCICVSDYLVRTIPDDLPMCGRQKPKRAIHVAGAFHPR